MVLILCAIYVYYISGPIFSCFLFSLLFSKSKYFHVLLFIVLSFLYSLSLFHSYVPALVNLITSHTFYKNSINIDTRIYISSFIFLVFFCEMLLNICILGTETLHNTSKMCCFLQIHSIKCSHLLFTILEIISVFLYGPVALCFLWTVSVNWFHFLSALCFAKARGRLLFLFFWDKTTISRYWTENRSLTVKKYGCHCVT